MKKAIITKVTRGTEKGKFKFQLTGIENEVLTTSATFENKETIIQLIADYFPDTEVVDLTEKSSANFILVED